MIGLLVNLWLVRAQGYRVAFIYCLLACAAFALISVFTRCNRLWRLVPAIVCPVVFGLVSLPGIGAYCLRLPGNEEEVRQAVVKQKFQAVFFDSIVAANVFGWRLPENSQALHNCKHYSRSRRSKARCSSLTSRRIRKFRRKYSDGFGIQPASTIGSGMWLIFVENRC